jgi:hypothetical protein
MIARKTIACREEQPPAKPELFPDYLEVGWWCWSQRQPDGKRFSWCDKHREMCEWYLDDTLAKLGATRASLAGTDAAAGCTRATTVPFCWWHLPTGDRAYVCALDREFCETTRASGPTGTEPCAAWAHD